MTRAENKPYRRNSRDARAFLTREQVFKLHFFHYDVGMSAREIAYQIWDKFGYSTPDSCYSNLRRAWRSYKLPIRQGRARCIGCECPINERTPGCGTCTSRHNNRAVNAPHLPVVEWVRPTTCAKCGCDHHFYTKGCATCHGRKYHRRKMRERLVEVTLAA